MRKGRGNELGMLESACSVQRHSEGAVQQCTSHSNIQTNLVINKESCNRRACITA